MRGFKSGSFSRERIPKALRRFSPHSSLNRLDEVDLPDLKEQGKKLILIDVDNTLLPWKASQVPEITLDWIKQAKELGFQLCILSNTRNVARLEHLSQQMEIPFIRDKFKPSRVMYDRALQEHDVTADEAVMIGDQLLTDVLGANRAGIDAIWVMPMTRRDFVGTTVISRNLERIIGRFLYKYFQTDPRVGDEPVVRPGLFGHEVVQQFMKFAVVGATSFTIDAGIHRILLYHVAFDGHSLQQAVGTFFLDLAGNPERDAESIYLAASTPLKAVSASLAILNSFIWNRRWTFGIRGSADRGKQLYRFVLLSSAGLLLNTGIFHLVTRALPSTYDYRWATATVIAAGVVAIWNFSGQKLWALKKAQK